MTDGIKLSIKFITFPTARRKKQTEGVGALPGEPRWRAAKALNEGDNLDNQSSYGDQNLCQYWEVEICPVEMPPNKPSGVSRQQTQTLVNNTQSEAIKTKKRNLKQRNHKYRSCFICGKEQFLARRMISLTGSTLSSVMWTRSCGVALTLLTW